MFLVGKVSKNGMKICPENILPNEFRKIDPSWTRPGASWN
jgi:hypothetical protein